MAPKKKQVIDPVDEDITDIDLSEAAESRYLDYSVSTIRGRSLPDVRDGLKPIHRRVLYAMLGLGLKSNSGTKKCARIVGDIIGRYSPHGDASAYEALIRMGQSFVHASPLVTVQGNCGSVDDPKSYASMRYTEAKLSRLSEELLNDLPYNTVPMLPNYDGTEVEPEVLPAAFPYFLCGSNVGIAVGFVTSAIPYNLQEVVKAGNLIIDNPKVNSEDLLKIVHGPDFPTGGTIIGRVGAREAFLTGRGMMTLRCAATIGKGEIHIIETPYLVSKSTLIESIVAAVKSDKDKPAIIPEIASVKDISDKKGVDILIKLKPDMDAGVVLRKLYKHTRIQDNIKASYTCIVDGRPREIGFKVAFKHWLKFRLDCLLKRHIFESEKVKATIHLMEGVIKISADPELAVRVIRKAASNADAVLALRKTFKLSTLQANYILEMQVRRLAHFEKLKIEADLLKLRERLAFHQSRIDNESLIRKDIQKQLLAIGEKFGKPRKTKMEDATDLSVSEKDLVKEEVVTIYLSRGGYAKRVITDPSSTQGRGGKGRRIGAREGDFVERVLSCSTHDAIFLATDRGKVYEIKAYQIPEHPIDRPGTHVAQIAALDKNERVTAIFNVPKSGKHDLVILTHSGMIKRTQLDEFKSVRSNGLIAIRLVDGDHVIACELIKRGTKSHVMVATAAGKAARFPITELAAHGRDTQGMRAYTKGGAEAVGLIIIDPKEERDILFFSEKGFGKRTAQTAFPSKHRNTTGVLALGFREKGDRLAGISLVNEADTVVAVSTAKLIKIKATDVRLLLRPAFGCTLMRLGKGESIASIGVEAGNVE
jgi:DNA gyrase subunit A